MRFSTHWNSERERLSQTYGQSTFGPDFCPRTDLKFASTPRTGRANTRPCYSTRGTPYATVQAGGRA